MSTTNPENKQQKNIQENRPQPFFKGLVQLIGYSGFAMLNVLRFPYFTLKNKAIANREINQSKELAFPLNGQGMGVLKDLRIGSKDFANSGCGAIATFNALAMAGLQPNMADIVDFYEHKGLVLNAAWGINPLAVKRYLKEKGMTFVSYKGKTAAQVQLEPNQIAILMYWWVGAKGCGAHYVAMEPCEKGIRVYNYYGNRDVAYDFKDVQAYLEHGNYKRVVSMFVIDKKVN